jgi:hypothetical protein
MPAPPTLNLGVVPAEQHIRHGPAVKDLGPRVLRILQQILRKGVLMRRLRIAQRARLQPGKGIHDDQRGKFTAGQDIVSDRDRIGD